MGKYLYKNFMQQPCSWKFDILALPGVGSGEPEAAE